MSKKCSTKNIRHVYHFYCISHLSDSSHLPDLVNSYNKEISLEVAANKIAPSTFRIDTLFPVNDIIWALRPNSAYFTRKICKNELLCALEAIRNEVNGSCFSDHYTVQKFFSFGNTSYACNNQHRKVSVIWYCTE